MLFGTDLLLPKSSLSLRPLESGEKIILDISTNYWIRADFPTRERWNEPYGLDRISWREGVGNFVGRREQLRHVAINDFNERSFMGDVRIGQREKQLKERKQEPKACAFWTHIIVIVMAFTVASVTSSFPNYLFPPTHPKSAFISSLAHFSLAHYTRLLPFEPLAPFNGLIHLGVSLKQKRLGRRGTDSVL